MPEGACAGREIEGAFGDSLPHRYVPVVVAAAVVPVSFSFLFLLSSHLSLLSSQSGLCLLSLFRHILLRTSAHKDLAR